MDVYIDVWNGLDVSGGPMGCYKKSTQTEEIDARPKGPR